VFLALSSILAILTGISNAVEKAKVEIPDLSWLNWLWLTAFTVAFDVPQPLFMLKTVTRLAFSRSKTRWVVSMRRVSPTHAERTSQRLDLRTSWAVKASVSFLLIHRVLSLNGLRSVSYSLPSTTSAPIITPSLHSTTLFSPQTIHLLVQTTDSDSPNSFLGPLHGSTCLSGSRACCRNFC
jgi:hypothetical protein